MEIRRDGAEYQNVQNELSLETTHFFKGCPNLPEKRVLLHVKSK